MRKHILFWLLVNWIGWIYAESVEKEIPQLLATLDSILVQTCLSLEKVDSQSQ